MSETTLNEKTEHDIALLLKAVHERANWKTIGRNSYADDVFSHKIKAAAYESSIPRFLDKLCYSLGVQSAAVPVELIKRLDADAKLVLRALAKETVYYVCLVREVK
ncbi:MAG: hypothetical protein WDA42_06370 [Candidatus Bathyarchaeia archaeon]